MPKRAAVLVLTCLTAFCACDSGANNPERPLAGVWTIDSLILEDTVVPTFTGERPNFLTYGSGSGLTVSGTIGLRPFAETLSFSRISERSDDLYELFITSYNPRATSPNLLPQTELYAAGNSFYSTVTIVHENSDGIHVFLGGHKGLPFNILHSNISISQLELYRHPYYGGDDDTLRISSAVFSYPTASFSSGEKILLRRLSYKESDLSRDTSYTLYDNREYLKEVVTPRTFSPLEVIESGLWRASADTLFFFNTIRGGLSPRFSQYSHNGQFLRLSNSAPKPRLETIHEIMGLSPGSLISHERQLVRVLRRDS